ncbi:PREDICTED: cyclic nucleotide-gated cation channel alpha-4 [Ficedula albicollis]|uniref:cyclic nucleotide-gated cation channel alpha-4 n=1 Tax=Ficedula albicollis TaxID=59894 RepID=UPI0007AD8FC9|nr:PREDICTED: cyclic nucleotide-gated cation channel alpha-4 [Ficedula albicollis]
MATPGTPTLHEHHSERGTPNTGNPSEPVTGNRVSSCWDSRHREPQYGHHPELGTRWPSHAVTSQNWTLDPAGDWHYRWISLMVLPILYNWVVLILRCCFPEVQEAHTGLWQVLDGLSDALYLLDIAVHCHTGFLEDGIPVRDVSRTRRRYLGSWTFSWDVLAVLPTELLCLLPGVPRVPGVPAARANRCLRVPRLFEAFDRCETRTGWPNVFRMAKLMLYLLLGIHWHGCLYFALSAHLGLGADPWVCPSSARPLRRYLHSFYFSTLVLAMVGDTPSPQREEEFLFLTAGFLLAVLGFATITGSISTVIVNLSSASTALYPDAGPVRRYLRAWGVGGRMAGRVVRWHQNLRGLVLRLRPQVFGPGEFVCRRGDVGREMYFIREGRLAVVAEDGVTQLAVLGEGLYFGEISLINIKGNTAGNRRTANILSRRLQGLEVALEGLQTRAARLLAQLEASALRMALRVQRLEGRQQRRDRAGRTERAAGTASPRRPARTQGPAAAQGSPGVPGSARAQRPSKVQGAPRAQGPAQETGSAGGWGPTGVQSPSKAQGPCRAQSPPSAQGPSDAQGPPKAHDTPMVQGPPRAQRQAGARGPRGMYSPRGAQAPLRAHGTPMVQGPLRAQGPPRAQRRTGARGRGGTYGPSGAQALPRARGPSGSRSSREAHDLSGAQGAGVPRRRGVPRD